MTMEQYKTIGLLYGLGMLVYLLWTITKCGGIKGFIEVFGNLGEPYGIDRTISLLVSSVLVALTTVTWPIFMHLEAKKIFKKEEKEEES